MCNVTGGYNSIASGAYVLGAISMRLRLVGQLAVADAEKVAAQGINPSIA